MHLLDDITCDEVGGAHSGDPIPFVVEDRDPILLRLVTDENRPRRDSSWLSGFVGSGLSVLFHAWLIVTLAGIAFDEREPIESESIDTVLTNDEVEDELDDPREFELADPDDRELEVQKVMTAVSVGLEFNENPAARIHATYFDKRSGNQSRAAPGFQVSIFRRESRSAKNSCRPGVDW